MASKLLSLNKNDYVHSFIWSVLFAIIAVVETSMSAGVLEINWHTLWFAILGAFINILKRFLTNSNGKIPVIQKTYELGVASAPSDTTTPPVPPVV